MPRRNLLALVLAIAAAACSDSASLTAPDATLAPSSGDATPAPAAPVATASALVSDNFSSYGDEAALRATFGSKYSYVLNGELLSLDKGVAYKGHPTLKYTQPGGTDLSPQLTVNLPGATDSFWYREVIRFSPGWTDTGVLPASQSANAYKLFGWGWAGPVDDRGTLDFTNTNEYQLSFGVHPRTSGHTLFAIQSAGTTTTEWTDGGWYQIIVHWEKTSETSGRARVWIGRDGETPALRATTSGTVSSGTVPSVDRIMIGMNHNQIRAAGQNQAIWIGEWSVVDGRAARPFGVQ